MDEAGSLGYGAIFKFHWLSGAWSVTQSSLLIAYKELFPIVVRSRISVRPSVGVSAGQVFM